QTLEVGRNPRAASLALVTPEELEALALPADKGSGRHHHQCAAPIEPMAEPYESHLRRMRGAAGFDFAFLTTTSRFSSNTPRGRAAKAVLPQLFQRQSAIETPPLFHRMFTAIGALARCTRHPPGV